MLNQAVIVGRLIEDVKLDKDNICYLTIVTPRPYKNANGEYDNDIITAVLYNTIAQLTCENCHKGDLVGIKGRLERKQREDNTYPAELTFVAEKVTFLSSKAQNKE